MPYFPECSIDLRGMYWSSSGKIAGVEPVWMGFGWRLLLSVFAAGGLIAVVSVVCSDGFGWLREGKNPGPFSWWQLAVVLVPCTLAYLTLVATRAMVDISYDRYYLFPELIALLLLSLYYQERVGPRLPVATSLLLAFFGGLDVAAIHDLFAMLRAQTAATQEVLTSGVPATGVDAGWQYNGLVQVDQTGHVNDPRVKIPAGAYVPLPLGPHEGDACHSSGISMFPSIQAQYVVTFNPDTCGGASRFPAVTYHAWLAPHERTLYVVKGPFAPQP